MSMSACFFAASYCSGVISPLCIFSVHVAPFNPKAAQIAVVTKNALPADLTITPVAGIALPKSGL